MHFSPEWLVFCKKRRKREAGESKREIEEALSLSLSFLIFVSFLPSFLPSSPTVQVQYSSCVLSIIKNTHHHRPLSLTFLQYYLYLLPSFESTRVLSTLVYYQQHTHTADAQKQSKYFHIRKKLQFISTFQPEKTEITAANSCQFKKVNISEVTCAYSLNKFFPIIHTGISQSKSTLLSSSRHISVQHPASETRHHWSYKSLESHVCVASHVTLSPFKQASVSSSCRSRDDYDQYQFQNGERSKSFAKHGLGQQRQCRWRGRSKIKNFSVGF